MDSTKQRYPGASRAIRLAALLALAAALSPATAQYYGGSGGSVARAGDELRYMSSHCASMQEAIRTASARSIGASTQMELQRNFADQCSEERSRALRQLSEQRREKSRQQELERQDMQKQVTLAENAEKQRFAQCAEMRKSINDRKVRPNMTEGERNDLTRFEQRYVERCK
jgi:hypothetical protein